VTEMARLSRRLVLTVHMSGRNWGYPWHRFLHRALGLPWSHGPAEAFFADAVRRRYEACGLEPLESGSLDMPFWPDPPGLRDVRLHRAGLDPNAADASVDWSSRIESCYRDGRFPLGLRALGLVEDLPWPRVLRETFSHLFFVLGRVDG